MKRIFVGIPISKELQKEILEWRNNNPSLTLPSEGEGKIIRWLEGKNLHITLVPPWYSDDYEAVIMKLETLKGKVIPFEIKFDQTSFGPNPREPRLIWASGKTPQEILDLRLKIYDILGQQAENRPFQLHATLARFRIEDFGKFTVKTLNEQINWQQRVTSFALYESHLSSQGADYEILAEFPLL